MTTTQRFRRFGWLPCAVLLLWLAPGTAAAQSQCDEIQDVTYELFGALTSASSILAPAVEVDPSASDCAAICELGERICRASGAVFIRELRLLTRGTIGIARRLCASAVDRRGCAAGLQSVRRQLASAARQVRTEFVDVCGSSDVEAACLDVCEEETSFPASCEALFFPPSP